MISGLWTMFWLGREALAVLVFFWPVSLLLLVHVGLAAAFSWSRNVRMPSPALIVPFVWPFLVLMIGGSGWQTTSRIETSHVPLAAVEIIAVVQFLLSAGIIYQLKGQRWLAAAVCMVAAWLGVISCTIAEMAITYRWI
jgi:hypothetical protein